MPKKKATKHGAIRCGNCGLVLLSKMLHVHWQQFPECQAWLEERQLVCVADPKQPVVNKVAVWDWFRNKRAGQFFIQTVEEPDE